MSAAPASQAERAEWQRGGSGYPSRNPRGKGDAYCPYKGTASYWTVIAGDHELADAVWSYPHAEGDAAAVSGYLSFLHDDLTVEAGLPPA